MLFQHAQRFICATIWLCLYLDKMVTEMQIAASCERLQWRSSDELDRFKQCKCNMRGVLLTCRARNGGMTMSRGIWKPYDCHAAGIVHANAVKGRGQCQKDAARRV